MVHPFFASIYGYLSGSLRLKLGLLFVLGMTTMAGALSLLMFSNANSLFEREARANLDRKSEAISQEIDNLAERAEGDLLLARENPALEEYFAASNDAGRAAALSHIHELMHFLQKQFSIDEICLIDVTGQEIARIVREDIAAPDDLSPDEEEAPFFAPAMRLRDGEVYRSTEPYMSPDTEQPVVAFVTPIYLLSGELAALLHFEIPLTWFAAVVNEKPLDGGLSFLIAAGGDTLTAPGSTDVTFAKDPELRSTAATEFGSNGDRVVAAILANDSGYTSFETTGESYEAAYRRVLDGEWVVVTALSHDAIFAPAGSLRKSVLLIALPLLALALTVMLIYTGRLLRPLRKLTEAVHGIAEGDLETEIQVSGRDELGQMAAAFREMTSSLRDMAAVADAISEGNLSRTARVRSERDVLGISLQRMTANLRDVVGQVQSSADTIGEASQRLAEAGSRTGEAVDQVGTAVQGIASGATGTTNAAQSTTVAVTELTTGFRQIAAGAVSQSTQVQVASETAAQFAAGSTGAAGNAAAVAGATQQTREAARSGERAVNDTIAAMTEIWEVVGAAATTVNDLGVLGERIGAVVDAIHDIAEETNLLALNAAIEAARAGENGRGFAVVAGEVRRLAERVSSETQAIGGLIAQVQSGTRDAVSAIRQGTAKVEEGRRRSEQAGQALAEILRTADLVATQVTGIAAAVEQSSAGAREIADALGQISEVAEQNGASTHRMAGQAEQVGRAVTAIVEIAEENQAAAHDVASLAVEMGSQVESLNSATTDLTQAAGRLRGLVARFTLGSEAKQRAAGSRLDRAA